MKQEVIRRAMIDGTIHVIAREGLDRATTKALATESDVNEVYIYRFFDGKEDLFAKTFDYLDEELVKKIQECLPIMHKGEIAIEDRCWMMFSCVWRFLLGNAEKCICFIRYYYSTYYKKLSYDKHFNAYKNIVTEFTPAFKEGADVWMTLNYILDVMLSYAIRVYNGELENNDHTAEFVYNLVYAGVEPQLWWSKR